jgi:hypothetical protein
MLRTLKKIFEQEKKDAWKDREAEKIARNEAEKNRLFDKAFDEALAKQDLQKGDIEND